MKSNDKKISVLIPSYGRLEKLSNCLRSVKDQTFKDIQIIVVNDAYPDFFCEEISQNSGIELIHMDKHGGPAAARNRAVEKADGDILVFIDSDVYLKRDTIEKIAGIFSSNKDYDVVQCVYSENCMNGNLSSQFKHLTQYVRIERIDSEDYIVGTSCLAVKRGVLLKAGSFPEVDDYPANEDRLFGKQLLDISAKIYLGHEIKLDHDRYFSFPELLRFDMKRTVSEIYFLIESKKNLINMFSNRQTYIKAGDIASVLLSVLNTAFLLQWNLFPFMLTSLSFILVNSRLFYLWSRYSRNYPGQYIVSLFDNLIIAVTALFAFPFIIIRTWTDEKES